jgi:hypothetical protein
MGWNLSNLLSNLSEIYSHLFEIYKNSRESFTVNVSKTFI